MLSCFIRSHTPVPSTRLADVVTAERPCAIVALPYPAQVLFQQREKLRVAFEHHPFHTLLVVEVLDARVERQLPAPGEAHRARPVSDRDDLIAVVDVRRKRNV